ncbi:MAG: amidohydrolase family protein [Endomicrobiales bacterium]
MQRNFIQQEKAGIPAAMHPEYQEFQPEDPRLRPLFEACAKNNLIVLFHAGVDLGYPDVHCTPKGVKELLDIPGLTLVLAHMGGYRIWDDKDAGHKRKA